MNNEYVYLGYTITLLPSMSRDGNYLWQIWKGLPGAGAPVDGGVQFGVGNAVRVAEEAVRAHRVKQQKEDLPAGFVSRPHSTWTLNRILIDAGLQDPGETV